MYVSNFKIVEKDLDLLILGSKYPDAVHLPLRQMLNDHLHLLEKKIALRNHQIHQLLHQLNPLRFKLT